MRHSLVKVLNACEDAAGKVDPKEAINVSGSGSPNMQFAQTARIPNNHLVRIENGSLEKKNQKVE